MGSQTNSSIDNPRNSMQDARHHASSFLQSAGERIQKDDTQSLMKNQKIRHELNAQFNTSQLNHLSTKPFPDVYSVPNQIPNQSYACRKSLEKISDAKKDVGQSVFTIQNAKGVYSSKAAGISGVPIQVEYKYQPAISK